MALATFSDLKTTVADFLNRSDLTSVIPTFVLLAESKIRRVLRGAVATNALSASSGTVALPSDYQEAVSLYHAGTTYRHEIGLMSPDQLSEQKRVLSASGVPVFGSILNRVLTLAPAPDQTYTLTLNYYADLESLSDSQTTNWVMTSHPDVYLYGALAEAEPYLKNDERIGVWREQFQQGLAEIELKYTRQHYGANTPLQRPSRAIG